MLTDEDVIPKVSIDMALKLSEINYGLIDEISMLEPYEKEIPSQILQWKNLIVRSGARILVKRIKMF